MKALDEGFAFSSVFQSEKDAMSSGRGGAGRGSSGAGQQLKCETERISCLPPPSPSFITARPFQEALISPPLILTRIRDNKQPINGGLNQEMELESAAQFRG